MEWDAVRQRADAQLAKLLDRRDPRFGQFYDELVALMAEDMDPESRAMGYAFAGFVERVSAYKPRARSNQNLRPPVSRVENERIRSVVAEGGTRSEQAQKVGLDEREFRRRLSKLGLTKAR